MGAGRQAEEVEDLDDAIYDGAITYSEAVLAGADRFDMLCWGPPQ